MTFLESIIEFINSKNVGDIISRKELIELTDSPSTDVYRRKLTIMGFIEYVDAGRYKKIKHIPSYINTSLIIQYPKNKIMLETLDRSFKINKIKKKIMVKNK